MITCLPGLNKYYKQRIKRLAQGHNTVTPVSLELTTPGSPVLNSTKWASWLGCPSQQFFSHVETISCLSGLNQFKQQIKRLAQGHNTVTPVSLELATPGSPVLNSTKWAIGLRCPSQQFFSHIETISCLSGLNQFKQQIKCLAQGHNTVTPVSL